MIPNDATEENKVQVEIEYAEKAPIDITYIDYGADTPAETLLVKKYRDGDIVLPDNYSGNGCGLKLQFL